MNQDKFPGVLIMSPANHPQSHLLRTVLLASLLSTCLAVTCFYKKEALTKEQVGTCTPLDVSTRATQTAVQVSQCPMWPHRLSCVRLILAKLNSDCKIKYGARCLAYLGLPGLVFDFDECKGSDQSTVEGIPVNRWIGLNKKRGCPYTFTDPANPTANGNGNNGQAGAKGNGGKSPRACYDVSLTPACKHFAHPQHLLQEVLCNNGLCATGNHIVKVTHSSGKTSLKTMKELCSSWTCSSRRMVVNTCIDRSVEPSMRKQDGTVLSLTQFDDRGPIYLQKVLNFARRSISHLHSRFERHTKERRSRVVIWIPSTD